VPSLGRSRWLLVASAPVAFIFMLLTEPSPPPRGLYWPTKVGAKLLYDTSWEPRRPDEIVTKVDGELVTVRGDRDRVYRVNRSGVALVSGDYEDVLLDLDALPGESWLSAAGHQRRTYVGMEKVGRFDAARVDWEDVRRLPQSYERGSDWYAKDVGLAKSVTRLMSARTDRVVVETVELLRE
jgi:hypothetical protein